jgi:hypothetical protein
MFRYQSKSGALNFISHAGMFSVNGGKYTAELANRNLV